MSRNKYGLPTKKTKVARSKKHYLEGGQVESDEPEWKKIARDDQARRDAYNAPASAPAATKTVTKSDDSVVGKIKARKSLLDRIMAGDDEDAPVKKAGGVIKSSRGNGVAVKGHGRGKFR
jgi:hypothetical protein